MTDEQRAAVKDALRRGRQYSHGVMYSGTRETYLYEDGAFKMREQDAYSDHESFVILDEEELDRRLDYFGFAALSAQLGID